MSTVLFPPGIPLGNVSLTYMLYLLSTNRSINTLQSLTNSSVNCRNRSLSMALEVKGRRQQFGSIRACALKLIWRLLQRMSSLLYRDIL